jgi:polyhydroxyalkanoate synthesis regulator phasin
MARRGTTGSGSGASRPGGRSTQKARRSGSTSSAARTAAAKKGGQARARQQKSRRIARETADAAAGQAPRAGVEAKTVAEFREALRKNLIRPMDMVMLTRQRIEEVLGEAVERGAITANDAQGIGSNLLRQGRSETNAVLRDLEALLGRSRDEIEGRDPRRPEARGDRREGRARAGLRGAQACGKGRLAGARDRRPSAPRGGRRPELPDHRLRLDERGAGPEPAPQPDPRGASQAARPRAAGREPQDRPPRDRGATPVAIAACLAGEPPCQH